MGFTRSKRVATRLHIALMGPTNAGKTYTALVIANGLIQAAILEETGKEPELQEVYDKIAVIDSEHGKILFYSGRTDLPHPTGEFLYTELNAPFTPANYIRAFKEAVELVKPHGVVVIDSLTHAWAGKGGVLDMVEDIKKRQTGGNSFSAWKDGTAEQTELIETILQAPVHVICTMRTKMEYVLEMNDKGKQAPVKIGTKPVQRDDTEFEFDITLALDNNHNASVIKDVTFLNGLADTYGSIGIITPELGKRLYAWQAKGLDPAVIIEEKRAMLINEIKTMGKANQSLVTYYKNILFPNKQTDALTYEEALVVKREFESMLKK